MMTQEIIEIHLDKQRVREEVERLTINQARVTFGKLSNQKLFQDDDANDGGDSGDFGQPNKGHFWCKTSHDGAEVDYDDNAIFNGE